MNTDAFIHALADGGVTHVVGLPDTQTGPVFQTLRDARESSAGRLPSVVPVCREGEAFAIAAGLWGGGARPIVLIQSTGLFEAGDSLRNIVFELEVPIDMIVGYRGYSGKLNAGQPDTARHYLEPILNAWNVPYDMVDEADGYRALSRQLNECKTRPVGPKAYLLPE